MEKKKFWETGFGKFLTKAGGVVPEILDIGGKAITGNFSGAIEEVGDLLKKKAVEDEQARELYKEFEMFKMTFAKECFELEVDDRKDARDLYKTDDIMQKIFAIVFLVGYGLLSWYLLSILMGTSQLPKLAETMITMIWTGTSSKLSTIIDFFFGGSVKK